ncbi:TMAO reductase system periplasmic protein TorT [Maridesulfovibrio frigidus]|uniref:TMAO reductase system periplasmic protein TorT n=1 Tax=Maridesulfovibrio frigidus TaxID=340956 RepID=UPI000AD65ECE|nr:TMAO reductase system periplasmic protein TorT [Maridesulfovibrio frigidus]
MAVLFFSFAKTEAFAEKASWTIGVDVWTPPFNESLKHKEAIYVPLESASKKWRIAAFIPHLKDSYWLSANYGLMEEAKRIGINLTLYEAGGYVNLYIQRDQIKSCIATLKPDGLIIGAISETGLNDIVIEASKMGIPVVDLANTIRSPHISARVASSFQNMGILTGNYLNKLQAKKGKPIDVAWFPGPRGAGWVESGVLGFTSSIEGKAINIVATEYGDTGRYSQRPLIAKALSDYKDELDVIVGTAPSAEEAARQLKLQGLSDKVDVISYYYTPAVDEGIRQGRILAAPTDSTVALSRIAVDTMVRILEGRKYYKHVAPSVVVIDQNNIKNWDSSNSLPPTKFHPIFSSEEY